MKQNEMIKIYILSTLFAISIFLLPFTLSKYTTSYSNNKIVLSVTKPNYTIKFDSNGGIGSMEDISCKYDDAQVLPLNTFTNGDKIFLGWNTEQNGTGKYYGDNQEVSNLIGTDNGIVTLYAQWLDDSYLDDAIELDNYTCTESVETFTAPNDGYYLLEAWGAQGGSIPENINGSKVFAAMEGGRGGYSYGILHLNEGNEVYVAVGCKGKTLIDSAKGTAAAGGYNGGGQAISDEKTNYQGSGGGATHFAINSNLGELKNYASNQNDILLVAGGGGGSYSSIGISYFSFGGVGGGQLGGSAYVDYNRSGALVNGNSTYYRGLEIPGGTQTEQTNTDMYIFGTFGQGTDALTTTTGTDAGAGGGWYGGSKLSKTYGLGGMAGGGGSGHINTSIFSSGITLAGNVKMPTHDGTSFMNGNEDDGYARISFINLPYTVKFDSNGGTGSMDDMSFVYGTAQNLTANTFTRSEYEFVGWNTKADGTGTSYSDEQSVNNLSNVYDDKITLYAQWRYRVIYFQLPPDWYGSVYAKIYVTNNDDNPTCTNDDLMTLVDSEKQIYKFDTSNYSNIDNYEMVYFTNGITIEDASGTTSRRAVAQNFKDTSGNVKLGQIFVPELYNVSEKTRVYGYATNFYFYLWKGENNNGWPGTAGEVIGRRFHKVIFNTSDYENMVVNQGSGSNQSDDLLTPAYQDITYKLTSTQISGKKYVHAAFRLFYEGSWHKYEDWLDLEYDSWYASDYVDFQTAQTNLGY